MSPDATDDKFLKPALRTAKPISESPTGGLWVVT
jgi:hypothetical protein